MASLVILTLSLAYLQSIQCAPDSIGLNQDILKQLSKEGELYIDEEMKRALFGVKQMMEIMEKEEELHKSLINTLLQNCDKKKGAVQLATEAKKKIEEAEQQCHVSLRTFFEECHTCLEGTCKAFYTSTCHRRFSTFSFKVEEFFRTMSSKMDSPDQVYNHFQEYTDQTQTIDTQNQEAEDQGPELMLLEASFKQLKGNISLLYNRSTDLVNRMQKEFGHTFWVAFNTELKPNPLSPTQEGPSLGFLGAMGLEHILDSVYGYAKTVLGEFSYAIADVIDETQAAKNDNQPSDTGLLDDDSQSQSQDRYLCQRLRRQASDCWQLQSKCESCDGVLMKECPGLRELNSELEEIHLLLNVSRQQCELRLQAVKRHTEDTIKWLTDMGDKYGWVALLSNGTLSFQNIFSVIKVVPYKHEETGSKMDTNVVVTLLGSVPLALTIPAELELEDPAFVQYMAKEALSWYKHLIKGVK